MDTSSTVSTFTIDTLTTHEYYCESYAYFISFEGIIAKNLIINR